MDPNNTITATTETGESSQEISNIVGQHHFTAEKILRGILRPALSLGYELLKIALEILAWIMIPPVAFMFAAYFSQAMFGTDTFGQLATITTFLVAAVAGIRGAMRAEAKIKSFKAQW